MYIINIIGLIVVFLISSVSQGSSEIKMGGDGFCPFTCTSDGKRGHGLVYEIAKSALGELPTRFYGAGHDRLVKMAENGSLDIILYPAIETVGKQCTSEWDPVMYDEGYYFGSKDLRWDSKNINDFKGKLAVHKGSEYPSELASFVKNKQSQLELIPGHDFSERSVGLLRLGRVDLVPTSKTVFQFFARKLGFEDYKNFGPVKGWASYPVHICVVKKSPRYGELMKKLKANLQKMKESGEIDKTISRYLTSP